MKIITRREAKELGLKRYFTGKPCKYGHVCEQYCSNYYCVDCSDELYAKNKEKRKEYQKFYYVKNKERIKKVVKKYAVKNKEKKREYLKKYAVENRERLEKYKKKYAEENREVIREKKRKYAKENREKRKEYLKKYVEENREMIREKNAERWHQGSTILSDPYIRHTLKGQFGLSINEITPELIEMKREQLKQYRLKKAIAKQGGF